MEEQPQNNEEFNKIITDFTKDLEITFPKII